jgi:hypothetical protein
VLLLVFLFLVLLLLGTLLTLLFLLVQPHLLVFRTLLFGSIIDLVQCRLKSTLRDGLDRSLVHEPAAADVGLAMVLTTQFCILLRLLTRLGRPFVHFCLRDLASTLKDLLIHGVHGLVNITLSSSKECFTVGVLLFSIDISSRVVQLRHLAAHATSALIVGGVVIILSLFAGSTLARASTHGQTVTMRLGVVAIMFSVFCGFEVLVHLVKSLLGQLFRGVLEMNVAQSFCLEVWLGLGRRSARLGCRCASVARRIRGKRRAILIIVHLLRHRYGGGAEGSLLSLFFQLDFNWRAIAPHLRRNVLTDVLDAGSLHGWVAVLRLWRLGRWLRRPHRITARDCSCCAEGVTSRVGLIRVEIGLYSRWCGSARASVFLRLGSSQQSIALALRSVSAIKLRAQIFVAHSQSSSRVAVLTSSRLP